MRQHRDLRGTGGVCRYAAPAATGFSPTFATRREESWKRSVFCGRVSQGRHHRGRGHYDIGVPSDMILGGG
jgi:hypothetical protein